MLSPSVTPPHDFQDDIDAIGSITAVRSILDVVCRTTGMGFSAVARVTEDRWIVCDVLDTINFGLQPGGELKVQTTICHEIRQSGNAVVIDQVSTNPVYRGHPTPAQYGFESYISMPIIMPDGSFFGTLCAIDPRPAKVQTPEVIGMFKLFAELIAFHLDAHSKLARSEATLLTERAGSELREQFIAVLGHDLRNPLASIEAGARMLGQQNELSPKSREILGLMRTTVKRMGGLVDNLLDFARGRLGGGLTLDVVDDAGLDDALEQVIAEARSAWPDRQIETSIARPIKVASDPARIAQLFSNLLGNAITHGAADNPIRIAAAVSDADGFELSVCNGGKPIPVEAMEQLFKPFYRGNGMMSGQGLGLGLFIASEIARAHQGQLSVDSTDAETKFTFRMPVG